MDEISCYCILIHLDFTKCYEINMHIWCTQKHVKNGIQNEQRYNLPAGAQKNNSDILVTVGFISICFIQFFNKFYLKILCGV